MGLIGYYRKFILGYAKIVEPLFGLTKKECTFVWTPIYQEAFVTLKKCLVTSLVLTKPNFSQLFILDMDCSMRGVGAILSQKFEKRKQVMPILAKDYLQFKSVSILWKANVMPSYGA